MAMKFKIMGKKGDNVQVYEDLETQQLKFNELFNDNYLPVALNHGETGNNVLLKEFDPDAKEILWMPKMGGG